MSANGNKRKPRGKPFPKGNKVGNRFKPGKSGNPDGRPKCEKSPSEVLREIQSLAFANMLDYLGVTDHGDVYVDLSKLSREQAAAIQEVTVEEYTEGRGDAARQIKRTKFKLSDKGVNLERLGKFYKLFTDKHEHTGKDNGPLKVIVEHIGRSPNPPSA
jgi:hypothetical protein